ncbi:MAG: FAD-dependent oxidoreductase [Desulfobacterales bacterium]|nr:FAD-dependent oxidoreductase [Desulfobacterales bacterium]
MNNRLKLDNHPKLKFEHKKTVNFYYNGHKMQGYEGETVASALYANGIRIFSRSFKYHRPRGISCNSGHCSNCMMRVNGIPNVRTCSEPLTAEMKVESQNAWPSLEFDIASLAGYMDFLLKPGFYYKSFIRPRWLYHIWENFLRERAGIGKIPEKKIHYKQKSGKPDVLIIGGGIAGISAAIHAASAGANVLIAEKENSLGGSLRFQTENINLPEIHLDKPGYEIASETANMLDSYKNCQIFTSSAVFGWYADNIVGLLRADEFWELEPSSIIVATGSYEYPLLFKNNDLPGIYLGKGLMRLMNRDGNNPGQKAVVITVNDYGYVLAQQIINAGISVKAVCDYREENEIGDHKTLNTLQQAGTKCYFDCQIQSAIGKKHVSGISFFHRTNKKKIPTQVSCDFICTNNYRAPANEFIFQKNYTGSYVMESPYKVSRKPEFTENMELGDGFYVAGEASGVIGSTRANYLQGKIAGLSAALSLNVEKTELLNGRIAAIDALKILHKS